MHYLTRIFIVALLMPLSNVASSVDLAQTPVAQLVWVNPGPKQYDILIADYVNDEWQDPVSVYRSENPLAGVALASNAAKSRLLVWSEQRKKRLVLLASMKSSVTGEWSSPTIISNIGSENTGAVAMADLSGKFWVFWASNPSGMDDIYYSSFSALEAMKAPRRLNPVNSVPDYYPSAQVDKFGNILVSWKTFDLDARAYTIANSVFELDSSNKNSYKLPLSLETEISEADIALPSFLPRNGLSQLHLPSNTMRQSVRLNNAY